MLKGRWLLAGVGAGALWLSFAVSACVNVKAPEEINVGTGRRPAVDAGQVPPTASHEEARQKLAEAYEEIRYLQGKVRSLEDDKRELKRERDEHKDRYERIKEKYED